MEESKCRLAIVPIRGEPCELEVPTSTSASELEALVSKHEGTPVGKWKMSLQPLPSAAPRMPQISEIRDEVDNDPEWRMRPDEEIEARIRQVFTQRAREASAGAGAAGSPVLLADPAKTLAEYGIQPGSLRKIQVILDFGSCHMDRPLHAAKS